MKIQDVVGFVVLLTACFAGIYMSIAAAALPAPAPTVSFLGRTVDVPRTEDLQRLALEVEELRRRVETIEATYYRVPATDEECEAALRTGNMYVYSELLMKKWKEQNHGQ